MTGTIATPDVGTEVATSTHRASLWNVVLLDDNDHSYDYVIEMLCALFFFSATQAFRHAVEVDTLGRTIVLTCEKEQAEFARGQIHAYGADPRMPQSKGSMSAIIEPAAGDATS